MMVNMHEKSSFQQKKKKKNLIVTKQKKSPDNADGPQPILTLEMKKSLQFFSVALMQFSQQF